MTISLLLTVFLVELDLHLELRLPLQGLLNLRFLLLLRLLAEEELAGAPLLHDLGPREPGELAEAIGAVDDGIVDGNLGVAQDEVAV